MSFNGITKPQNLLILHTPKAFSISIDINRILSDNKFKTLHSIKSIRFPSNHQQLSIFQNLFLSNQIRQLKLTLKP